MLIKAIKTHKIRAGEDSLLSVLNDAIDSMPEGSILAVTSKIVSLCENNVIPLDSIDREALIVQEADMYLPPTLSKYGSHFTIINNTLISAAGIDESNGEKNYVLWPKDVQATANQVRIYLKKRFKLKKVGVIITDSISYPMRRGSIGVVLAYSGFQALNDYRGKPDLFGRLLNVSVANVANSLSSAAVLAMGEGDEQTPLAIASDLPFINFQDRNPSRQELEEVFVELKDDLFAPFLEKVDWQNGDR